MLKMDFPLSPLQLPVSLGYGGVAGCFHYSTNMSANPVAVTSSARVKQPDLHPYSSSAAITLCILSSDFLILSLVFAITVLWRHLLSPTYQLTSYFDLLPFLAMMLGVFWIQGLYPGVLMHPAEEMRRIFGSITAAFLIMACAAFLWRTGSIYSRSVFLLSWAVGSPMVLLARFAVRRHCKRFDWWGVPALILGSDSAAQRVARTLSDGRWGVKVVGMLSDDPIPTWASDLPPVVGPLNAAPQMAKGKLSPYAIIAMPHKSPQEIRYLIQDCCYGFQHILLVPDLPGICSLGIATREIGGEVGFEMPQRLFQTGASIAKRTLDFTLSLLGLIVLAPVFLLLALAIRIASKGPAFYRQTRYGREGKIFGAFKFRSMVPEADRILADYLALHPEHLFEWQRDHKLRNDPRVTPIGKWLRHFSLDELPQLWNVLAGQMSLVGPRPIVKAEIEKYGHRFGLYSRVRPGITGLWQVSGRNNTTYEERIALDEYYVRNWSVWFDAYILLRTVKTLINAEGAF